MSNEEQREEQAAPVAEGGSAAILTEGELFPSLETLMKELDQAKKKAEENWDKLVRTTAEMDNLRKRQQRDLENAHKFALERFSSELLQVRDSLELGHQAAIAEVADVEKLREGTELTLKLLTDVMVKFGVEAVDPLGDPFNPELHQAMSMAPGGDGVAPNTVIQVFQKGYTLNGRLLRPAMVLVSQAAG